MQRREKQREARERKGERRQKYRWRERPGDRNPSNLMFNLSQEESVIILKNCELVSILFFKVFLFEK